MIVLDDEIMLGLHLCLDGIERVADNSIRRSEHKAANH
jgi:hypothetical protein